MSVVKVTYLYCDAPPCDDASPLEDINCSARDLRQHATNREESWRHMYGKDLCEECKLEYTVTRDGVVKRKRSAATS